MLAVLLLTAYVITTGRLCFDTCLSVCPQEGGTPTRSSHGGGTPARSDRGRRGVPQAGLTGGERGTPARSDRGGTPARSDRGVLEVGYPPPSRDGVPQPGLMGVPPPPTGTGQQMEYLIRPGRSASCVYAGGLSCDN